MGIDFSQERGGTFQRKFTVSLVMIIVFFVIVVGRLFYLQVIRGSYYVILSQENTVKEIRTAATRGVIFDRNRIPIAENRPSFNLALIPQHVKKLEQIKETLHKLIGLDPAIIDQKWKQRNTVPRYYPLVIKSDIPYDEAVKIRVAQSVESETDPYELQGVEVITQPLRSYPLGPIAANTLGYISEISEKELTQFQKEGDSRYFMGDLVGASGLEKYYEKFLRGRDGLEQKIVDAVGREILNDDLSTLLQKQESAHGYNLVLSLDSSLQKFAEEKFADKAGALVALDPRNGEVLAMVSQPQYDPEKLVSNVGSYWGQLVMDPRKLLLNRAMQGAYPPGSTFKVVTAIASLEEKVVTPKDTIPCPGGLQYGGRFFKCWNKGGHGATSLHRSIAESCDTYYYIMGLRLGVDRIAKYANLFGLGLKTNIDVEGEKSGLIPTAEWKKRVFKQDWQPGENLSISVGQGYDTATPLQNALMVAQVATGKKIQPHFLKMIEDDDGRILKVPENLPQEKLPISDETLKIVRAAMLDTVESPGGTAHGSRLEKIKMAGKTGTAQVMSEEAKGRAKAGVKTGDHAWFVVFAPYEDPKIAVAVIVEHGGFGASAAAPIAKAVIEKYLTPVAATTQPAEEKNVQ